MGIRQISLNDFRNLKSTTLDLHKSLNLITGLNASGKTSFLEAIHILCQGQSFKTRVIDQCIQIKKNGFLLFAHFNDYKVGISRSLKKTAIRINNETIHRISSLAEKTPIRIINSSSFDLITGTPAHKREFIDWCLFHVEHNYLSLWLEHKHVLKQRNALLKQKNDISQLDYWDEYLSRLNLAIYKLRLKYIENIKQIFDTEFNDILLDSPLEFVYEPGWDVNESLRDVLLKYRSRDLKFGFTRYGVHRDDIKLFTDKYLIQNYLSRGQLKKISILLILCQIILIKNLTNKHIILLIDDLDSELDSYTIDSILAKLANENIQIFITSIAKSGYSYKFKQEYKMFHVEHGMIKAVKNT